VPQDNNNFSPNIGFAWTPRIWEGLFGRDKTVIRGGYRIAYDPAFYNIFLNVQTSAPFVNAATVLGQTATTPGAFLPGGGVITGQSLRDAGLFALAPRGADPRFRNQTTVAPDFHNPYTQQWSLGVQRQITPKMAAEVRYVGNHTIGNFQSVNANPLLSNLAGPGPDGVLGTSDDALGFGLIDFFPALVPAGVTPCTDGAAAGFGRVDCDFALVRERRNGAFSIYHGLQSRLDIQNWHGVTAGASYTWSRAIDNASEIFATFAGGNTTPWSQSPFDTNRAERSVSGTSFPHVASVYWIYEMPWYRNQQGVLGNVLGGWQLNGTWRFQSGQPFNPIQFNASLVCDPFFQAAFNSSVAECRPFLSNTNAALDTVGTFCNGATFAAGGNCFDAGGNPLALGTFVDLYDPCLFDNTCAVSRFLGQDDVHWIYNDTTAATILGSPYGDGRNTLRGPTVNNVDFGIFKNTRVNERITVQFQANIFNLFNRQFRSVADPLVEDFPLSEGGSFMNEQFNTSNNRNMWFGLKIIF
jgi:hypothetical protein